MNRRENADSASRDTCYHDTTGRYADSRSEQQSPQVYVEIDFDVQPFSSKRGTSAFRQEVEQRRQAWCAEVEKILYGQPVLGSVPWDIKQLSSELFTPKVRAQLANLPYVRMQTSEYAAPAREPWRVAISQGATPKLEYR